MAHVINMDICRPPGEPSGEKHMEKQSAFEAARLREKAAHCRKLALDALSSGTADELESIAREYEDGAEKLDLGRVTETAQFALRGDPAQIVTARHLASAGADGVAEGPFARKAYFG
jgi:hypothetical protein